MADFNEAGGMDARADSSSLKERGAEVGSGDQVEFYHV